MRQKKGLACLHFKWYYQKEGNAARGIARAWITDRDWEIGRLRSVSSSEFIPLKAACICLYHSNAHSSLCLRHLENIWVPLKKIEALSSHNFFHGQRFSFISFSHFKRFRYNAVAWMRKRGDAARGHCLLSVGRFIWLVFFIIKIFMFSLWLLTEYSLLVKYSVYVYVVVILGN